MSTKPSAQDGAVHFEATSDSDSNADVSPVPSPEQIHEEAMARLVGITDEWHKARDALLGG